MKTTKEQRKLYRDGQAYGQADFVIRDLVDDVDQLEEVLEDLAYDSECEDETPNLGRDGCVVCCAHNALKVETS